MYIRKTTIKTKKNGQTYYTYRLVESERTGKGVRQRILLNLGKNFPYPQEEWPVLASRIQDIFYGQQTLLSLPVELEEAAQYYAAQLIQARGQSIPAEAAIEDYQEVDLNSLELYRPRSVGAEHVALSAANKLQLKDILTSLKFTTPQIMAAVGTIIGRMCSPGSEAATCDWLKNRSALGELLDYDYGKLPLTRLYQASDLLLKYKQTLEEALFDKQCAIFGLEETITLYDLTNTYFEGQSQANKLAAYGRSKEKRSDCPLVTLALVLDGSGFPKRSEVFAGNASEPKSLAQMLSYLEQTPDRGLLPKMKPTIVMDAGIATQDNIDWLKDKDYKYLVVSRQRQCEFSPEDAVLVREDKNGTVRVQRVVNEATGEVELYCHSSLREQKETAIKNLFGKRLEEALQKLAAGLTKKGCIKKYDKVLEQIGRLKQKYPAAAKLYQITAEKDEKSGHATRLTWEAKCVENTADAHPGVYCLRSNQDTWDEAALWRTYTMLTDLEAVFKSLKSELGLRPVFHQNTDRVKGHLFISVLAYHLVHTLRFQLKQKGISGSWATLRKTLSTQQRITTSMRHKNGEMVHIRKSTRPEPAQQIIYDALTLPPLPGRTLKLRE